MTMRHRCLSALAAAALLAGCASPAPPYAAPEAQLPDHYDTSPDAAPSSATALAWQDYFSDATLRPLIDQALAQNHDLRLAVLRLQEAQALYGVQRSASLPTLALSADATRGRTPADLSVTRRAVTTSQWRAGLAVSSWEIDFWGRLASLNESALQSVLATDEARRATTLLVVAGVADAYLGLREVDERLRLAQDSAASQRESLRIFGRRFEVGAASRLELTQVQTLVTQAEALVTQLQQLQEQQRHALDLLVGRPVAATLAPLPEPLAAWRLPTLPAGLPSALLLARPDLVAAEHRLRAAHAQIGAARAAFFPTIQLTAFGGTASDELDGLFKGAGRSWSFAPRLVLPLFDGGRNQANLDLAQVRTQQAVVQYEQAVQVAFREVADALSARRWLAEQLQVQQQALAVQQERARLSRLSHDQGASSFLDVLDAERSLIAATQQLTQTQRALLSSQVALYRALGGGSASLSFPQP